MKRFGSRCIRCGVVSTAAQLEHNLQTCHSCGYCFPLSARRRIESLVDTGSWQEWASSLRNTDPLQFVDTKPYRLRLQQYQSKTGLHDTMMVGTGRIDGIAVGLAVMEFQFHGGSVGSVAGESLTRMIERSTAEALPIIIVSASGGARIQEGMLSLMQMAKTSAALARHAEASLPYISVLANPTTGCTLAGFASLGDVVIAEPGALIGYTGARIIQKTSSQALPDKFQTAEFCLEHGHLDMIVDRRGLKLQLARILRYLQHGNYAKAI